jgi:hypothetical protein
VSEFDNDLLMREAIPKFTEAQWMLNQNYTNLEILIGIKKPEEN